MIEFREPDILLRDIPGYENYQIGENGEVYNKTTGKELKKRIKEGYYDIKLYKKNFTIHRLLAEVFVPNPLNKPIVDHVDRNSLNNNLNNLRWVSASESCINRGILSNNTSGHVGVSINKTNRGISWRGIIHKDGKKYSKSFSYNNEGLEEAIEWRKQKEDELHKF